jgi:hypothetical protein
MDEASKRRRLVGKQSSLAQSSLAQSSLAQSSLALDPGAQFVSIDVGLTHSLCLKNDGSAVAYGCNARGQCAVPALSDGVLFGAVAAGVGHSVFLCDDGTAVASGDNSFGQCDVPQVLPLRYTQIAAGGRHTVLLRSDGHVVACGDNSCGQCDIPLLVDGGRYVQASASWSQTLLVLSNGRVKICGSEEGLPDVQGVFATASEPPVLAARREMPASAQENLRLLVPLLEAYRSGQHVSRMKFPTTLAKLVGVSGKFHAEGGAVQLAAQVARGARRADAHAKDRGTMVLVAVKFIAECPNAEQRRLLEAAAQTRAQCEGRRPQLQRSRLAQLIMELGSLASFQAEQQVAILRVLVSAFVCLEVFAHDLSGRWELLLTPCGDGERAFYFTDLHRGGKALHQLTDSFHQQRRGHFVDADLEVPSYTPWWEGVTSGGFAMPSEEEGVAAMSLDALNLYSRCSATGPVVIVQAPVWNNRKVASYTYSSRLGDQTPAVAAEVERCRVATARGWALGVGRLQRGWTRSLESYVYLSSFTMPRTVQADLGSSFSFEFGDNYLAVAQRVLRVQEFVRTDDREATLQEQWLCRLVASYKQGATLLDATLEHDLLSLYASNHALCYSCFLPLFLRGPAMSLAEDGDFQGLLEAHGVELMQKRYRGDSVRKLDHERCSKRHTKARLARGRAHLISLLQL